MSQLDTYQLIPRSLIDLFDPLDSCWLSDYYYYCYLSFPTRVIPLILPIHFQNHLESSTRFPPSNFVALLHCRYLPLMVG
jgi:hypothetical protein